MSKQIRKPVDFSLLIKKSSSAKTVDRLTAVSDKGNNTIRDVLNLQFIEQLNKIKDEVAAVLPGRKALLDTAFGKFKNFDSPELKDVKLSELIIAGIESDKTTGLNTEEINELKEVLRDYSDTTAAEILELETSIDKNPFLTKELRYAKNLAFGKIIGLDDDKIKTLANADFDLLEPDEEKLDKLIKDRVINADQKEDLVLTGKLAQLTGENFELITELRSAKIETITDLVGMNSKDWLKIIADKKITVPEDEISAEEYSENLNSTIEKSFPTEYFMHRKLRPQAAEEIMSFTKLLNPLLKKNVQLFGNNASDLAELTESDWAEIPPDQRKIISKARENALPVMNTYRYLGVGDIIQSALDENSKQQEINSRFNALSTFFKNNPGINLVNSDFTADLKNSTRAVYDWKEIDSKHQPFVQKQLAAFQRSYVMAEDHDTADRMLKGGFDSAYKILSLSEEDFISASGLSTKKGRMVYEKAKDLSIGSTHYMEAIRDGIKGNFKDLTVSNQQPLVNDLKEIDGFADLFGNMDFCDCEHCRSIFSPGAYFSDLMYFVQQNVSKKVFTGSNSNHPLYLKRRRPDLWELELSCKNTSTEIPYLAVVNEVLERYLKTVLPQNDIYVFLKNAHRSVNQPFDLSLETLRLYLSHFDLKLYDIYQLMNVPLAKQHREFLQISKMELHIITTKDIPNIIQRFGNHALNNFSAQDFISFAGISRTQLDELLATTFITAMAPVTVTMIADPSDIQKYRELVQNLTNERLDYIHRYLRLWRKTGWSIPEFDLVLNALKAKGLLDNLEEDNSGSYPKVLILGHACIIKAAFNLTIEELVTIIHQLPEKSIVEDKDAFLSKVFDVKKLKDNTIADKTPVLLAGLGITEVEFIALNGLFNIDISQEVNISNLSSLYRQARIAKSLKWNIIEFRTVLRLILNDQPVQSMDDMEDLLRFAKWFRKSPLKIAQLKFILTGEESNEIKYKYDSESVYELIQEIQNQEAVKLATDDAVKLEMKRVILQNKLQSIFNITNEQFKEQYVPELVSTDYPTAAEKALNASFTNNLPDDSTAFDDLKNVIRSMERYSLLFEKYQLEADDIAYVVANPQAFGINNLKALNLSDIKQLGIYRTLVKDKEDFKEKLWTILSNYKVSGSFNGSESLLSEFRNQALNSINSVLTIVEPGSPAVGALDRLKELTGMMATLGVQADSLTKLVGENHEVAAELAIAAFLSKYDDDKTRKEKQEPYLDKINTLKRDALCDFIISKKDSFKFKDRSDLYAFFLLSVDMSGCSRTSALVSAITSLQLYIHRCTVNLEQSDVHLNPSLPDIKVLPTYIPKDEWEWRKNYRVWEANRKVFLYPENYIEPSLRDTKTHIFKDLEDELLQQKITRETAEEAYKKYLSQFSELAKLRYAGAYYQEDHDSFGNLEFLKKNNPGAKYKNANFMANSLIQDVATDDSQYYFFARTNIEPYQYYFRTYNHKKRIWGNWKKMDISIEAREISALIVHGKLYVFWTEVKSKELSKVSEGTSSSKRFMFTGYLKYAFLNENEKWSAPQRVVIGQNSVAMEKIYGRVYGGDAFDKSTWERKKDSIIERFEKKVFRKPYSVSYTPYSLAKAELRVSYIWTHERSYSEVTYTVMPLPVYYEEFPLKILFVTPMAEFTVINDDFSDKKKNISINVVIEDFFSEEAKSYEGELILNPGGTCFFYVTVKGVSFSQLVLAIPNAKEGVIKEKTFTLSLPENDINGPSTQEIFGSSPLSHYKQEYIKFFNNNGEFATHVEQGTLNLSENYIVQDREGNADLVIRSGRLKVNFPLDTILTNELSDVLHGKGLESFLSLQTQTMTTKHGQQLDFRGPYGMYYWEMFFHIPFLIAHHFNANQKYKEAKWWYERIFDPTADEKPDLKPSDHNWQFAEFRGLDAEKLKEILTDTKTIEVYKEDPFDPHAIAQLRISAYQKAIVMKYIDNLLDWGDALFTQDTRESINEAEMLYQLASDILGRRPVKMGKCKSPGDKVLTYKEISEAIGKGSEFLITLENYHWNQVQMYRAGTSFINSSKKLQSMRITPNEEIDFGGLEKQVALRTGKDLVPLLNIKANNDPVTSPKPKAGNALKRTSTYVVAYRQAAKERTNRYQREPKDRKYDFSKTKEYKILKFKPNRRFPSLDLVRQTSLAFCVPENKDLLQYWDRVDDRLFKIWNCMNIKGIRRSLSLFQPPIDPMMLVRLRASGLSLEDAISMAMMTGGLPHYRFAYLLEKARQYAQTAQGFGSALLSALEKKDGEELLLLRSVHEKNILRLTKETKKKQLEEAKAQVKATEEGLKNIENRIDYYDEMINAGLTGWEVIQQVSKHAGTALKLAESVVHLMAGITYLIPQVGSPFSMKYGGQELGHSGVEFAEWTSSMANIADAVSASAGLEATFQRREQEWKHQLKTSKQEQKQNQQQLLAAEIRELIAEKDFEIHEKSMEQSDELHDFYKSKFTNLGLYNFMASTLNRIYRSSFNIAQDLAKLAERAYNFETFRSDIFIQSDNWQFDKAGLLAGDRLLLQLQEMEKAYMEKNERVPEITQSFSLALLDASNLIQLRQTGTCVIKIPEIAFEVLYPGQYRRIIKSVRISIPCIAGPHTNISARLTLLKGEVEKEDKLALEELIVAKNTSITTSSANNDAGVFDLNFKDERYLPFEGAGAISEWRLELPAKLRSFNYDTIADVIVHISYTALDGDRVVAEDELAATIIAYTQSEGVYRIFSLRHEFPAAFHLLLHSDPQKAEFEVEKMHFPYVFMDKLLSMEQVKIYLKPKHSRSIAVPASLKINGDNTVVFSPGDDIAQPGSNENMNKIKGGSFNTNDDPVGKWTIEAGNGGLDTENLDDVVLAIKYKIE